MPESFVKKSYDLSLNTTQPLAVAGLAGGVIG